ncbi:hypothetical protein LEQ06_09520 [Paraclostridium sp. AKS46]|nr:hypothetical protein [Paraclostridium sp. AKS46]
MSSTNNILEPLVDSLFDVTKLTGKLIYKLLKIEENFDIEKFFKTVDFKNKKGEFPKQIKIYESKKGYAYLLSVPVGLSLKDFSNYQGALELQLKNKIEIKERKGYIEIEVITKELKNKINYTSPCRIKDSIYIPFAESLEGTVYLDLKETAHTLCTGTTGGGKSVTTKNIITSVINLYPNEIDLYLVDFKIVELSIFKKLKQCKVYVNDIDSAKEVIADLMEECKRRYKLFDEVGACDIYEYNKKVPKDKKLKFQFIVIEEFVMLLQDKKKIAMTTLKTLASLSRASGQFLYITAQRFDNTVIDLVLRSVIGNRICHLVESENDSKLIIDKVGADKLRGNGHILFKNGGKITECQSYYITNDQVKNLTKKYTVSNRHTKEPHINYTEINKKVVADKKEDVLEDLSFLDNL